MKELKEIVIAYDKAAAQGKQSALATVVHLEGSSYRRPGARMLITDDGQLTGAISGGCLEGDALQKALLVMVQKKARIVTYDTMDDDDSVLGVGLGCNGVIQVLIEPIDPADENNPISFLKQVIGGRQKVILVTMFSLEEKKSDQWGTCLLLEADGQLRTRLAEHLSGVLKEDAEDALDKQKSSFRNYGPDHTNLTAFIEYIPPVLSIVIIGAGNDILPLVEMADILGWETTVVDGRPSYARAERFSKSCRVLVSKPEQVLEQISIDEYTVFLLMTHNYFYDRAMLKLLLQKELMYVGVLGSKKKLERMLTELAEEGFHISEEKLKYLFGPVGLDIGAETPEEIALSIIAEIKAIYSGRDGQSMRLLSDAIHSRVDTVITERKLG